MNLPIKKITIQNIIYYAVNAMWFTNKFIKICNVYWSGTNSQFKILQNLQ